MNGTSAVLILSGIVCLAVCGITIVKLRPQDGKPTSPWIDTDTKGTAMAMGLLVLLITGISLVLKGVF